MIREMLYILASFYSLVSPIIMLFGGDKLNQLFAENRFYYRIFIVVLALLLEGLNIIAMTISRHISDRSEKTGCLILITSIIGFIGVLYFFIFWSECMF